MLSLNNSGFILKQDVGGGCVSKGHPILLFLLIVTRYLNSDLLSSFIDFFPLTSILTEQELTFPNSMKSIF